MEELLTRAALLAPALRTLLSSDVKKVNLRFTTDAVNGEKVLNLADGLSDEALTEAVQAYVTANGTPDVVTVNGLGSFAVTANTKTGRLAGKVAVVTGGAKKNAEKREVAGCTKTPLPFRLY